MGIDSRPDVIVCFSVTVHDNRGRIRPGSERDAQFAGTYYIETYPFLCQNPNY